MRRLIWVALFELAFLLLSPIAALASNGSHSRVRNGSPSSAHRSPLTLQVSAGYGNVYRDTTWTPVRVRVHNSSGSDVSGVLRIPQSSQTPSLGATQAFHGLYQEPLTIPAGGTKEATLYVPGSGVQGEIDADFGLGGTILARARAYPLGIDSSVLMIGVMGGRPETSAWIPQSIQQQVTTRVARLDPATFDPVPQALAAFDIIVLSNADTSQLDRAQRQALESYVRAGGSVMLVGGPTWQGTLRPLPSSLIPGNLVGTRVVRDLHGLLSMVALPPARGNQTTAISVLTHLTGMVMARELGVPLVVQKRVGQGTIEYLAFDPALNPVRSWRGAGTILTHLIASAAPLAVARTWAPQGFRARFQRALSASTVGNELSNLPAVTPPLLALFAALTALYIFLLGPANFVILRALKRTGLAWITIPALTVSYGLVIFGIATHGRNSNVQLNSVGMVTLDGTTGAHPATFYVGLNAPFSGDYHLAYSGPALAAPVQQFKDLHGFFWRNASTITDSPLGLLVQEGARPDMTFLSMQRWSMRGVSLDTAIHLPGSVQSNLTVDRTGDVVGTIHNGMTLDLLKPVIVSGQTVTHLRTIPAGGTVRVRVKPAGFDTGQGQSSVWAQLYGGSDLGDGDGFGRFGVCCDQMSLPRETTLIDRLRNASAMLAQAQPLATLSGLVLAGWTTQPLGTFTVDGSTPQQRALNLMVMPMALHLPSHGPFQIQTGTLAAHLVDIVPQAPQSSCCNFFSGTDRQVTVGPGGSLTFAFSIPNASHVAFQSLGISVNSGDEGTSNGLVYDWQSHRWIGIDLSSGDAALTKPSRFVSADGTLMLKLQATAASGNITIDDPNADVQLTGVGKAA